MKIALIQCQFNGQASQASQVIPVAMPIPFIHTYFQTKKNFKLKKNNYTHREKNSDFAILNSAILACFLKKFKKIRFYQEFGKEIAFLHGFQVHLNGYQPLAMRVIEKPPKNRFFDQFLVKNGSKIRFFGFFSNFPGGPPGNRKNAIFWSDSTYPKNRVFFKKSWRKPGFRPILAKITIFTYF